MNLADIVVIIEQRAEALAAAAARVDTVLAPGSLSEDQIAALGARSDALSAARRDLMHAIGVLSIAIETETKATVVRAETALATIRRVQGAMTHLYRTGATLDLTTIAALPSDQADTVLRNLVQALDAGLLDGLGGLERLTALVQPPAAEDERVVPFR